MVKLVDIKNVKDSNETEILVVSNVSIALCVVSYCEQNVLVAIIVNAFNDVVLQNENLNLNCVVSKART